MFVQLRINIETESTLRNALRHIKNEFFGTKKEEEKVRFSI
jgi:hypothetical protein